MVIARTVDAWGLFPKGDMWKPYHIAVVASRSHNKSSVYDNKVLTPINFGQGGGCCNKNTVIVI